MEINGTMGTSSISQATSKVATMKTENQAPQQGQDMSGEQIRKNANTRHLYKVLLHSGIDKKTPQLKEQPSFLPAVSCLT